MLVKYMTAGVAASALLATVAFAQNPSSSDTQNAPPAASSSTPSPSASSPSTPSPSTGSQSNASYQGDWRASKIVGLNVYNNNNESIGSINDLLTDKNGSIKAVVIGVGGFLGVGEHLVAIPFDQVKFVNEPVAYTGASNTSGKQGSTTTTGASSNSAPSSANSSKSNPWYPDHATVNASKDQLKSMPEFKYST
jgi:sporulation protein YlmC with PRC-barrel domain